MVGCADVRSAAIPATCGVAIEVPKMMMMYLVRRLWKSYSEDEMRSEHDTRVFTPGLWITNEIKSWRPGAEKAATLGAGVAPSGVSGSASGRGWGLLARGRPPGLRLRWIHHRASLAGGTRAVRST